MSLNSRIHDNFSSYTSTEKKVAKALFNHPNKVKQLSIQELAEFCGVSTATITRFCHKNGYKNFMELRLAIPNETNEISAKEDSILEKVLSYYRKNLHHSIELIDEEKLALVTHDIKTKRIVYLWGLGSSGKAASEFEQTLIRMGILVKSITDPHVLLLTAPQVTKDDLVLIVSISGQSTELIQARKLLDPNCCVVALTSNPNSPIAQQADYMLQISDIRINNKYFVNFQLSLIFIIDCIAESLLMDDQLRQKFDKTVELLLNNPNKK